MLGWIDVSGFCTILLIGKQILGYTKDRRCRKDGTIPLKVWRRTSYRRFTQQISTLEAQQWLRNCLGKHLKPKARSNWSPFLLVVLIRIAPIGSYIRMLGHQGVMLLEKGEKVWPYWMYVTRAGQWAFRSPRQAQCLFSLPATCSSICRTLSYFSSTVYTYMSPGSMPWW